MDEHLISLSVHVIFQKWEVLVEGRKQVGIILDLVYFEPNFLGQYVASNASPVRMPALIVAQSDPNFLCTSSLLVGCDRVSR